MAEVRCDCCDLPLSMCGKAAERRKRREAEVERAALLARPGWFAARYGGQCAGCGDHFTEGDAITRHGDGYKGACCA